MTKSSIGSLGRILAIAGVLMWAASMFLMK